MNRVTIYIIASVVVCALIAMEVSSCKNKRSRSKIDKLLVERRFEDAREVANKSDNRTALLQEISQTQFTLLMDDGDYEAAASLARELQMENLFYDAFFKNIRQITKRGNYNFIFETIMDWKCPYTYETVITTTRSNIDYYTQERKIQDERWAEQGHPIRPGEYNYTVRPVNNAVDVVLQKVMYEGNPTTIRRCLMCYKPYAIIDRKEKTNEFVGLGEKKEENRNYKFYFKQQNTAKEDAEKMLREAKIEY